MLLAFPFRVLIYLSFVDNFNKPALCERDYYIKLYESNNLLNLSIFIFGIRTRLLKKQKYK